MQPSPMSQPDMQQYQPMNDDTSPRGFQEFSPPMDGNMLGRKRTFSMSEGASNAFATPGFPQRGQQPSDSAWQTPSKFPHGEQAAGADNAYTSPSMNGTAKVAQPFWSQDSEGHGAQAADESADSKAVQAAADDQLTAVDIDEKALDV
jgi:hypothetical protein